MYSSFPDLNRNAPMGRNGANGPPQRSTYEDFLQKGQGRIDNGASYRPTPGPGFIQPAQSRPYTERDPQDSWLPRPGGGPSSLGFPGPGADHLRGDARPPGGWANDAPSDNRSWRREPVGRPPVQFFNQTPVDKQQAAAFHPTAANSFPDDFGRRLSPSRYDNRVEDWRDPSSRGRGGAYPGHTNSSVGRGGAYSGRGGGVSSSRGGRGSPAPRGSVRGRGSHSDRGHAERGGKGSDRSRKPSTSSEKKSPAKGKQTTAASPLTLKGKSVKELKDEEIEKAAKMQIAMMAEMEAKAREKEKSRDKPANDSKSKESASVEKEKEVKKGVEPFAKPTDAKTTTAASQKNVDPKTPTAPKDGASSNKESKKDSSNKTENEKTLIISNAKFEDVHLFHLKGEKTASPPKKPRAPAPAAVSAPKSKPKREDDWFTQYKSRVSLLHQSAAPRPAPAPVRSVAPGFAPDRPQPFDNELRYNGPATQHGHGPPARSGFPPAAEPPRKSFFFNDVHKTSAPAAPQAPPVVPVERSYNGPQPPRPQPGGAGPPRGQPQGYGPPTGRPAGPQDRYRSDGMPPREDARSQQKPYELDKRGGPSGGEIDPTAYVEELSDMGDDWNEVVALLKDSPKPAKRPAPSGYPGGYEDVPRKMGAYPGGSSAPNYPASKKTFFRTGAGLPNPNRDQFREHPGPEPPNRYPMERGLDRSRGMNEYTGEPMPSRGPPTQAEHPNRYPMERGMDHSRRPDYRDPMTSHGGPMGGPPQARIAPAMPSRREPVHGYSGGPPPDSSWHNANARGPPMDSWKGHSESNGPPSQAAGWRNGPRGGPKYF